MTRRRRRGEETDPKPAVRERGRILFGLARIEKIRRPGGKSRLRLRLHWKRVFTVLAILAFVGWIAGGTALYFYFKEKKGFEDVSFFKTLVLPLRMDAHSREMGEYFIKKGKEEILDGDLRSGFHKLRAGVSRAPSVPAARVLVARVYDEVAGNRWLALKVVEDGFRYADQNPDFYGPDYVAYFFSLLRKEGKDAEIVEWADRLTGHVDDPEFVTSLQMEAARIEADMGYFDDALERLRENGLMRTPAGWILTGDVLRMAGEEELSLLALERGMETYPSSPAMVDAFFDGLAEAGRWEDLLSQGNLRRRLRPDLAPAWTAVLVAMQNLGREDEVQPIAVEILERFRVETVGGELLRIATEYGRPDVAHEVLEKAGGGDGLASRLVFLALAYLEAGSPVDALAVLDDAGEEFKGRTDGIRSLALLMLNDKEAALGAMQKFLAADDISESPFQVLGDAMLRHGYHDQARTVLEEGLRRYPKSRMILRKLVELDMETGNRNRLMAHAGQLIRNRLPPLPFLEEILEEISSDSYLFAPGQAEVFDGITAILERPKPFLDSVAVSTSGTLLRAMENPATPVPPTE